MSISSWTKEGEDPENHALEINLIDGNIKYIKTMKYLTVHNID